MRLLTEEEVPLSANVQFAHNPELSGTCSVQRPLSARETMNRAKAITARSATAQSPACIGQIFIGCSSTERETTETTIMCPLKIRLKNISILT